MQESLVRFNVRSTQATGTNLRIAAEDPEGLGGNAGCSYTSAGPLFEYPLDAIPRVPEEP